MSAATVMIVDDDLPLRESVCELLEEDGYRVVPVDSGAAALGRLRDGTRPDLILLDLMMPGMSGWQFREEQLRDPDLASIPVVVLTASRHARPIPDTEVVHKPLELQALLDVVRRHAGTAPSPSPRRRDVFAGGGEMGALMRSIDWSATPLGPVSGWSHALRTMVGLLLRNHFPMLLWWGPGHVQLYNDAYRPVPGEKHPRSMGQAASECWAEIWHIIGPMVEAPFRGGQATTSDDLCLLIRRRGILEETHFKFAYSPVPDETVEGTGIGGVLATVAETTEQVYAERQLRTLRELGARAADAKTPEQACRSAGATFQESTWDIPFALFYLLDEDGRRARRACAVGFDGDGPHPAAPAEIDLEADEAFAAWPLREAIDGGRPVVLERLDERLGPLPAGRWTQRPHTAIALPLASPEQGGAYGVLVCGTSPHRLLDAGYRTFFELAAAQVVTAIRNARAHEEAHKRAEALAAIDRAKTAFFSNVSHEFRTPLTLMLGPTEDLLAGAQGELTQEQRGQLELIRRNELRMQRLVNALLDFSRIEAGRAQACYEPVDLSALTADVASTFRSAIERAGLKLTVDCPPLDEPVHVDRHLWEQIVLNLLSNAFKFTFEGGVDLSLRPLGSDAVQLTVSDTGVGIRPEDMPRLFERFHRVEGTRARTHEGSGIGLALVKELARLHGGSIQARSSSGAGSTFTVTVLRGTSHLPADRIGAARAAPPGNTAALFVEEASRWLPEEPRGPSVQAPAAAAGRRVLVADDNADMREYVRRILEGQRWTVEAVGDGVAALASARARRPDLVLTDVMMPGLDGFRLLRELRADPSTASVPVVMLSARAGEEAKVEGLQAGADDYLVKPFSARELVARVGTQLKLASAHEAVERRWAESLSMLRQVPVAISLISLPERRYEFVNDAHAAWQGRDLTGMTMAEAFPDFRMSDKHARRDALERFLASGETVLLSEYSLPAPPGPPRYFSAISRLWLDQEGRQRGLLSVSTEVTDLVRERQRAEEALERLEEAEAQLRKAMGLRDEFLTLASHELRTPLTTLGLLADGLLRAAGKAYGGDVLVHKAEKLRAQVARLEQLIEGMLDVFTLGGDRLQLELEELDLAEVARSAVDRLRERSRQASASITLRAQPAVGRWDRARLEQVLGHLLSNAIKFGAGQPVDVAVEEVDGMARLSVRDRGIGIASSDQERIFGRFVRAVPHSRYGGFGLGLWIVRELVQAMGGRVAVQSQPTAGTTFAVDLPRCR